MVFVCFLFDYKDKSFILIYKIFLDNFQINLCMSGLKQAERVKTVVKYLSWKLQRKTSDIGRELGYPSNSYFSQLINGKKNSFKPEFLEGLAGLDPSINLDYLTMDSDEMLRDGYEMPKAVKPWMGLNSGERSRLAEAPGPDPEPVAPQTQPAGVFLPAELLQFVSDMSATIRSQQETIRMQQEIIREAIPRSAEEGKNVG